MASKTLFHSTCILLSTLYNLHLQPTDLPVDLLNLRTEREIGRNYNLFSVSISLHIEKDSLLGRVRAMEMASLKRQKDSDPRAANVASKVFVRSTKNGKVQKIVRELYLRQDIPCSSKICSTCLHDAPANANGVGGLKSLTCSFDHIFKD